MHPGGSFLVNNWWLGKNNELSSEQMKKKQSWKMRLEVKSKKEERYNFFLITRHKIRLLWFRNNNNTNIKVYTYTYVCI